MAWYALDAIRRPCHMATVQPKWLICDLVEQCSQVKKWTTWELILACIWFMWFMYPCSPYINIYIYQYIFVCIYIMYMVFPCIACTMDVLVHIVAPGGLTSQSCTHVARMPQCSQSYFIVELWSGRTESCKWRNEPHESWYCHVSDSCHLCIWFMSQREREREREKERERERERARETRRARARERERERNSALIFLLPAL